MKKYDFIVNKEKEGIRIDKFISEELEEKSRSFIQSLIENKNVTVNGVVKKSNYKLKENDNISINIPVAEKYTIEPENISIDIIYEDNDVIVVNKARGMTVHPAPGVFSGTLVNALLYHCRDLSGINGVLRPGIVHRIDKDTTGVLVVAKNDKAHNSLASQLKDHSMTREYVALVEGVIKADSGTIDAPLARDPKDRIKIAIVKDGRHAVTHYTVLERLEKNTLVQCRLETGRTHQIRVHLSSIKHPLVGDPVYGYKKQRFSINGQLLHAKKLGFIHPTTGTYMEFSSDLPQDFTRILHILQNELK
ncbi:MAG: RluA family pseudouridine synthase [Clostridiaceae bacterium]